jgi:Ala-tRNA(Pro) deacylase
MPLSIEKQLRDDAVHLHALEQLPDVLSPLERRGYRLLGVEAHLDGTFALAIGQFAASPTSDGLSSFAPDDLTHPPAGCESGTRPPHAPVPTISSAASSESEATHQRLISFLDGAGAEYTRSVHAAVRTSEEAAAIRGSSMASGAKAMLLSVKPGVGSASEGMVLAVISASAKLNSKLLRRACGCKSTRFASEEEVRSVTACLPGAVLPFGSLWGIPTYVDASLSEQGDTIHFNAGLRTESVAMPVREYLRVELPVECRFNAG